MIRSTILFLSLSFLAIAPLRSQDSQSITWLTWEEAMAMQAQQPKLIFVDVYTDWCGWCKRMDATTFLHPDIVKYMNEHYYAVKYNAETKDTLRFDNRVFVNEKPGARSAHQFAIALLDGKMSYPSYVVLGQPFNKVVVPGYMGVKDFERVIRYFVEGASQGLTFEKYLETYQSNIAGAAEGAQ